MGNLQSQQARMYVLWLHLQVSTAVHCSRQPVSVPTNQLTPRLDLLVPCSLLLMHMECTAARVGDHGVASHTPLHS